MYIYKEVDFSMFCDAFHESDYYKTAFTDEALSALFDYIEEFEPCMELDIIALCEEFCQLPLNQLGDTPKENIIASFDDGTHLVRRWYYWQ
jgi:hypothetical protein